MFDSLDTQSRQMLQTLREATKLASSIGQAVFVQGSVITETQPDGECTKIWGDGSSRKLNGGIRPLVIFG